METYYIPSQSGWKATSTTKTTYLRIKVVTSYNASTDKTTATFTLEAYNSSYTRQNWSNTKYGSLKVNGDKLQDFTLNSYWVVNTYADTTFRQITSSYSGYPSSWSKTVQHDASTGVATFNVALDFRLYHSNSGSPLNSYFEDKTGSVSLTSYREFTLSVSAGTGSGIVIERTASPKGESLGVLSNGAAVYRADTLSFSYSADTGYTIGTHTVNGTMRANGYSFQVTDNVSAVTTATVKSWSIALSPDAGAYINASRTSSPLGGAATGALANGDTVYYGDVLAITAGAQSGYVFGSLTITGLDENNAVIAAVVAVATSTQAGAWLYVNGEFASYQIMIFNGATWDTYIPYVYTGAQWEVF